MFRRFLALLVAFMTLLGFTAASSSASNVLDMSLTFKATQQGNLPTSQTVIPWATYTHESSGLFVDVRQNFDAVDAASVFIGRVYNLTESGTVQITPELGVIGGEKFIGLSPEFYIWGKKGSVAFITLNQLAVSDRSNDFLYHWSEVRYVCSPRLEVGLTWQAYLEPTSGTGASIDGGPLVRVNAGPAYVKAMYNLSLTETKPSRLDKIFLVVGWTISS